MKNHVDATDIAILKELYMDCNRPIRELAKKLRMHPNTLLQRIKSLEAEKVIRRYRADIDYQKLGYDMHAIVLIRIKKTGLEDENLLKEIAAVPEVQALYAVTGSADCIAIIKARTMEELVEVMKAVQRQPSVLRTTTFFVLAKYKQSHEFNPFATAALSNVSTIKLKKD